jgi:LysM repeat protein
MQKRRLYTKLLINLGLLLSIHVNIQAQEVTSPGIVSYIERYAELAIQEMDRTGIPASIKIAQGILETDAGRSELVQQSNNHFGIKCKTSWTGEKVYHDDDDAGECFRKYNSASDSYADHSDYLKSQPRYAFLFDYDLNDYKSWAWGLKKAGYATNPIYAQTLIKFIETYNLNSLNEFRDDDSSALSSYFNLLESDLGGLTSLSKRAPLNESNTNSLNDDETKTEEAEVEKKSKPTEFQKGIFTINGLKVVYCKANQSLLSIAKKNHVHLSQLLSWNELPKSTTLLKEDQLIFLQKKKKHADKDIHIVQRGESLYDISQKEGVRLESLISINDIDKNKRLNNKEKIRLNNESTPGSRHFSKSTHNKKHIALHVVKQGESLYTIAKKYKITIDSIKDANSMKRNELQVGQSLKIPK